MILLVFLLGFRLMGGGLSSEEVGRGEGKRERGPIV